MGISWGAEQIRIGFLLDFREDIWYRIGMAEAKHSIPRGRMGPAERACRSRLAQLVTQEGLMRGTLQVRMRLCGKPNCKCTRGERHRSLYLVVSEGGRPEQLFVPKDWESRVRAWVGAYGRVKGLLDELSRQYKKKVKDREA